MSTPTPEDLDRQAAEWAKDKCMYMNTATPETDAASFPTTYNGRHIEVVSGKVARKLERERDEIQNELNKCATQLVSTINDRNFIGVQLDLIRDEMLRIAARIRESGFEKHPNLSSILDYCERAQKDISVNYTPIQERDAWREKAERTCLVIHKIARFKFGYYILQCGGEVPVGATSKFCPHCGGRIVKEEK